jgi:hypothetical protein
MFQVAAWQAAVVGAILAVVQLGLGLFRERRESRAARAKFGYGLLDTLFADEWASEFLYSLDSHLSGVAARGGEDVGVAFDAVFSGLEISVPEQREAHMYRCLDSFLYFADRFEHALSANLTTFETVAMPTGYYVSLLNRYRDRLKPYVLRVGYKRVILFLARFDRNWAIR